MASAHQHMIRSFVRRMAWRLRVATLLESTTVVVTVLLAVLLLGAGLMAFAPRAPGLMIAFALVSIGALGVALMLLIRACLQRRSLESAALYVEAKHPELHNNLISALQLPTSLQQHPETGISRDLVEGLLEVTHAQIHRLAPHSLVDWSGVWRQVRVATPLVIATLVMGWYAPQLLAASAGQLLHPFALVGGQLATVTLGDYPPRVLVGQPLTVHVTVEGRISPSEVRLRSWHGSQEREDLMVASGLGNYRHTFGTVRTPVTFQAFAGGGTSEVGEVEVVEAPAVGNFRLRYQYPDYTRLPSRMEEGSGHIEALAGSAVGIEMVANKPISAGKLVFDDNTQLPLMVRDQTWLRTTAIVNKPGGYRVQVWDEHGFTNQDDLHYRIDVIPDAAPQVDLMAPEAELEIDDPRVIVLEYEARDDFGVRDLTLVYQPGSGGEKRLMIDRIDEAATRYSGRYYWDVTDLFSGASEAVTYYLEVWDNDSVTGPKRGISATHVLRIRGREEEHRRLDELQQQVAERLVDLLADQLELNSRTADLAQEPNPPHPEAARDLEERQAELQRQAQAMVSELDHMLTMLEQDYLSDYTRYEDTQTLRNNLQFTQDMLMGGAREQLSQPSPQPPPSPQRSGRQQQPPESPTALEQALARQEAAQAELERMSLFAQEIGKRAKMRDLENLAQRMNRTQKNVLDALTEMEKLGQDLDQASREALERELTALEQAMRDLMQALSQLPSELPDEFLNSEALQNLELSDMMQALQQLREQLQQGNLADAKRLAEDLLRSLNQMLAALQSAQQFAQSMPFGQQQSAMERTQGELDRIVQEQSEILRDTSAIDKDVRQRINEHQRQEFDALQRQLREAIQGAQRQLQEASRQPQMDNRRTRSPASALQRTDRALDRVMRQLTPEDADELQRSLPEAEQEIASLQQTPPTGWEDLIRQRPELQERLEGLRQTLQQAHQRLAELNALDGQELLEPSQREGLGQLGTRQQALQQRTEALRNRLEQLSQFNPFLGPELRQNIGEAGEFMGEAEGELMQRRARQAVPPEEEALRRLSQGQQGMQQAMQQMAQRGQMGQIPVPMALRRPGPPFAFDQQPYPDRSPWDQGRMGTNTRDFKIPGKEEYKAPKQFREEIMEALKRGVPSQFKGQIEQYFKNLTD